MKIRWNILLGNYVLNGRIQLQDKGQVFPGDSLQKDYQVIRSQFEDSVKTGNVQRD